MTMETAIFALLSGDAGVASIAGDRIFPQIAPEDVDSPFVTYQRISGPRIKSMDGPSRLAQPRIQIDAYAESYAQVKALSLAIRKRLDGYRGTVSGVRIGGISLETDQDFLEDNMDPKLHRVSMDFFVMHRE